MLAGRQVLCIYGMRFGAGFLTLLAGCRPSSCDPPSKKSIACTIFPRCWCNQKFRNVPDEVCICVVTMSLIQGWPSRCENPCGRMIDQKAASSWMSIVGCVGS
eukprot:5996850-Amphidinium_carterae.2